MKLTELQALAGEAAAFFPLSVIGGGAVRDAFLGGPIKDIDLFVDVRDMGPDTFARKVVEFALYMGSDVKFNVHSEGSVEGHFDTYHVEIPGHPVIEVLPCNRDVIADVNDYDFGISMVLMTKDGLIRTPEFDRDLRDNTITYRFAHELPGPKFGIDGQTRRDRSALRLQRILAKYPDRALVECGCLL
jgi:hypothetical protein